MSHIKSRHILSVLIGVVLAGCAGHDETTGLSRGSFYSAGTRLSLPYGPAVQEPFQRTVQQPVLTVHPDALPFIGQAPILLSRDHDGTMVISHAQATAPPYRSASLSAYAEGLNDALIGGPSCKASEELGKEIEQRLLDRRIDSLWRSF
jgi:hypothetical protein